MPAIHETFLDTHRTLAIAASKAATSYLAALGVRAVVTGSLARGAFSAHSDIDLLVIECPTRLKYAIEGIVEDALDGRPFDVIYLDELPPWKARRFMEDAIDASELR